MCLGAGGEGRDFLMADMQPFNLALLANGIGYAVQTVPDNAVDAFDAGCGEMFGELFGDGQPLQPWRYRDFGSLVSLGEYSTVGNLMGNLSGPNLWIEGWFARMMYLSLYKMHELALHGFWKTSLDTAARTITRRTQAHVKLH